MIYNPYATVHGALARLLSGPRVQPCYRVLDSRSRKKTNALPPPYIGNYFSPQRLSALHPTFAHPGRYRAPPPARLATAEGVASLYVLR